MHVPRPLLALALAVITGAASALDPACAGLLLHAKASRRTVAPGTRVRFAVVVTNTGPEPARGLGVRVSSGVAAAWKPATGPVAPRIESTDVTWFGQEVAPGKTRRFGLKARVCSGVAPGLQTLAEAAVFRLNATGGVTCLTSAPRIEATIKSTSKPRPWAPVCGAAPSPAPTTPAPTTARPTANPTTGAPTAGPTQLPTQAPSKAPTGPVPLVNCSNPAREGGFYCENGKGPCGTAVSNVYAFGMENAAECLAACTAIYPTTLTAISCEFSSIFFCNCYTNTIMAVTDVLDASESALLLVPGIYPDGCGRR